MMVSVHDIARRLDGVEYGSISDNKEIIELCKNFNILIVSGYSDDLIEFEGAFRDEAGASESGVYVTSSRVIVEPDCNCKYARAWFDNEKLRALRIIPHWCDENHPSKPSWWYECELGHGTFRVMEDGKVYCVGIVVNLWGI